MTPLSNQTKRNKPNKRNKAALRSTHSLSLKSRIIRGNGVFIYIFYCSFTLNIQTEYSV